MTYRDDLEAAAARVRALEDELAREKRDLVQERAENRRLVAELEADGPGGRQQKAAQAELSRRAEEGRKTRLAPVAAPEDDPVAYQALQLRHKQGFDRATSRAGLTAGGWFASLYTGVTTLLLAALLPHNLWLLMLGAAPLSALAILGGSRRLTERSGAFHRRLLRGLPFTVAGAESAFGNTGSHHWLQVDVQLAPIQVLPREGLVEDLASSLGRECTVVKQSDRSYRLRFKLGDDSLSDWWGNRRGLLGFYQVVEKLVLPLHAVHRVTRVRFELD